MVNNSLRLSYLSNIYLYSLEMTENSIKAVNLTNLAKQRWFTYLNNVRILVSYLEPSEDSCCVVAQTDVGQQDPWVHWRALGFGSFECDSVKVQLAHDKGDCERWDGCCWDQAGYCLQC